MLKEALQYIVGLSSAQTFSVGDMTWSTKPLEPVIYKEPRHKPSILKVGSLSSLADLIKTEIPLFSENKDLARVNLPLYVRVDSPVSVSVFTQMNDICERIWLYEANQEDVNFKEGWRDPQTAIIELRSRFIPNEDSTYLLNLLSKMKSSKDAEVRDNGVSQTVVVQQGISLVGEENIKPRVKLCPFRTFREVEQPESEFIFRVNDDGKVGLFEADGSVWKMEAKDSIALYLKASLEKEPVIVMT